MKEFNNLSSHEKCEILRKYAQYITSTTYFHFIVKLYSWDRFFIEVYYDAEEGEISRIATANQEDMRKHLANINLVDLAGISGSEAGGF